MDVKNKVSSKMRMLTELVSTAKLIILIFLITPNFIFGMEKEKLNPKTSRLIFQERRKLQEAEEGAVFRKRKMSVVTPEKRNFRRLIMILDPSNSESHFGALSRNMLDSLSQETSPILVSINIFNTIVKRMAYVYQSKRKLKKYAFCQKKSVAKISKCLVSQRRNTSTEFVLSQVQLNTNKWHVYYNKKVELILLLPKEYVKKITGEEISDTNEIPIFSKLGFKADNFVQLALPQPNSLHVSTELENILKKIYEVYEISSDPLVILKEKVSKKIIDKKRKTVIDNLPNIFQTHGKNQYLDYYWNIYAVGHGDPKIGKTARPGIVDLSFSDFIRFLEFMNNNINTNIFYYNTCYGGSLEAITEPYQKIQSALNYTIVSQATSNLQTIAVPSITWKQINKMRLQPIINFISFFDAIEKREPIIKILSIATGEAINAGFSANTPIVRFPGTEWFTTKWKTPGKQKLDTKEIKNSIKDDVVTIGNMDNLKHTAFNKPFKIHNKKIIIISTDIVTAPLIISHDFFGITTIIKSPPTKIDFSNKEHLKQLEMSREEIKAFVKRKNILPPELYFKEITIKNLESLFQIIQYNVKPRKNIVFYFEKINITDPEKNLPKALVIKKNKPLKYLILSYGENDKDKDEISLNIFIGNKVYTALTKTYEPINMHNILDANYSVKFKKTYFKYLDLEAKEIEKKAEIFKLLERVNLSKEEVILWMSKIKFHLK